MANEPFFTAPGVYQAPEFRRLLATFYNVAAPGGIINGMVCTAAGSSVSVSPGSVVINDSSSGVYVADSTTASTLALTSNGYNMVYVFVSETAGTELSLGKVFNTTVIPALSIPLAKVTVNSGGVITSIDATVANQAELTLVGGRYAPINEQVWTSPSLGPGWTQGPAAFINNPDNGTSYAYGNSRNAGIQSLGMEYKRSGNVMQLRGSLRSSSSVDTGNAVILIPAALAPETTQVFGGIWTDAIDANGNILFDAAEIIGNGGGFGYTDNFYGGDRRTIGGIYLRYGPRASIWHFNLMWLLGI